MFPKRKVNALTPIFASLHREKEDLSLPPKIPLRHVHNSLQELETHSSELAKSYNLPKIILRLLQAYRKSKFKKQMLKFSSKEEITEEQNEGKSVEELTNEILLSGAEILSPFSKYSLNDLEDQLEQIVTPFFIEHLVYGDLIQKVADSFQVIIGLKQPIRAGQRLLLNGYHPANFAHSLKFSEVGPTAGLLTYDPVYCEVNKIKQNKHQQTIDHLMSNDDAKLVDLQLSEQLIKNATNYGDLKDITSDTYAAIYFGQVMHFEIAAPDFIVSNLHTKEIVKVVAATEKLTPITDCYYVTFIASRENTPSIILAQKNKLIDVVISALNKSIKMKGDKVSNMFVFDMVSNEGTNSKNFREYYFFPKLPAKQLITKTSREILYQKLNENGFTQTTSNNC